MKFWRTAWVVMAMSMAVPAFADYVMVMASGEVMEARERYTIDDRGMVSFTLKSGPGISVTKSSIDWYETAKRNGEKPPAWAKPIKRKTTTSKRTSPVPQSIRKQLTRLRDEGLKWSGLKRLNWVGWLTLLGTAIVTYFIYSLVLFTALNMTGEPNTFGRVMKINLLIMFLSALIQVGVSIMPGSFWHVMIVSLVANFFVISVMVVQFFESDIPSGLLTATIYFSFVVLSIFGGWKLWFLF